MARAPARPLIAVTGPSRRGQLPRRLVQLAVWLAGGTVTHLTPADPEPSGPYQGVVITGGHDVDPVLYKAESEVEPRYDRARDALESRVIDDALERGLPLLGICRGAQLLNVRLGGSLFQDLRGQRYHTSHRWSVLPIKTLDVIPGTRLEALMRAERTHINTLHNQAIDRLGEGLHISGLDLDKIVQAVEAPERDFLIGVQWHPEFLLYLSRHRRLFHCLVEAATHRLEAA